MRLLDPPPRPPRTPVPPTPPPLRSRGSGARLWLVRHAEVADAWRGRAYGSGEVPLSPRGLEQTARLGERFAALGLDAVYGSDLARARAMAESIARASGAPRFELPGLREIDRGAWSGRPLEEFDAAWRADAEGYWRDPWNWRAHGGESDAQVFSRASAAIERVLDEIGGGTAALCTHGNWIRIVLGRALGVGVVESFDYRVGVATASRLVDGPGGWRLEVLAAEAP